MCGLCGIYNYGQISEAVSQAILVKMQQTIIHRGPDDAGLYLSPDQKVGLAHRRLSIIDLSPLGHQPMCNEDETIWIVFNGEIYNHLELRKELEKSHRYRSTSDTETIIHLYEEKGEHLVNDLDGMFAFVIWDTRQNRILAARDRLGKKPFYYTLKNGLFIFASEIKAILAHPQITPELDNETLHYYLTFAATPAPHTLFSGIKKLPPGHLLQLDSAGNLQVQEYWDAIVPNHGLSESDIIERIGELLKESVKKRMISDVPFGVFLSGGVDSSTNVALMAQMMNQPVKTFSVGFKDQPQMNEFEYARKIAELYKTEHHEIIIDQQDFMDYIPSLIYHQDEPIADWVCVPLYYVSKLARDNGVIVIQIGEGSDEIFFGYEGYKVIWDIYHKYWKRSLQLPQAFRYLAYLLLAPLTSLTQSYSKLDLMKRWVKGEELFWGGAVAWNENTKNYLFTPEFKQKNQFSSAEIVNNIYRKLKAKKPEADFAEQMIYLELKLRLPELLLMRVDKITMSVSVEGRAPYLDHKLVELAMGVPESLKIKGGQTKYLLKKAVSGLIPDEIIYRKKMGFGAPVREWMPKQVGKFIEAGILNSRIKERRIFNYPFLEKILQQEIKQQKVFTVLLWNIFNFCKWYDYWIAGEK